MNQPIRLNKFLAERIGVSRREADQLIATGKVTLGDRLATLGDRVNPDNLDKTQEVCYNGKVIPFNTDYLYIAFNKPIGYVCSRRAQGSAPTLYDLLPIEYRKLKTVGRLDKDSSGLILLTNDGDFAYQMTHPKFRKTKVYEVELDKPLQPLHQQMISDYGVMLDDGLSKFTVMRLEDKTSPSNGVQNATARDTAPAVRGNRPLGSEQPSVDEPVERTPRKTAFHHPAYQVILTEGRNRQIRRTFAALGYTVTKLHRTEFGKYKLGNLAFGKYDIINV